MMQPDGSYIREPDGAGTSSQERLYQYFSRRRVSLQDETPATVPQKAAPTEPETGKKPESAWERFRKLFT